MCHKWPRICFTSRKDFTVLSSFMTYDRVCNQGNTTGVTSGARTAYPSEAPEFTPGFSGVRVARSLVFCVVFCRSLFVLLSFFFWPLCFLSFFDLRILITSLWYLRFTDSDYLPLLSSNSSWHNKTRNVFQIQTSVVQLLALQHQYKRCSYIWKSAEFGIVPCVYLHQRIR